MKKFKQLVLLFLVASVTLVSCNKDDDEAAAALEGKWEYTQETNDVGVLEAYQHTPGCNKDYTEILAGGTIRDYSYDENGSGCEEYIYSATWTRSGNNISVTDSGETFTSEITELTATTLKIKSTDPLDSSVFITVYTRK
jgi:hypothetical protein